MEAELSNFLPIVIYAIVVVLFATVTLILAHVIGPRSKTAVKQMTYESGVDPVGDARQPFDIRFYLMAVLFLVFDVELLFLYPWAVTAYSAPGDPGALPDELRRPVFFVMLFFIATLVIAYVYAQKKGVFRWR